MALRAEIVSLGDKLNHTRLDLENLRKTKAETEDEIERLEKLQDTRASVLRRLREIGEALQPLKEVEGDAD